MKRSWVLLVVCVVSGCVTSRPYKFFRAQVEREVDATAMLSDSYDTDTKLDACEAERKAAVRSECFDKWISQKKAQIDLHYGTSGNAWVADYFTANKDSLILASFGQHEGEVNRLPAAKRGGLYALGEVVAYENVVRAAYSHSETERRYGHHVRAYQENQAAWQQFSNSMNQYNNQQQLNRIENQQRQIYYQNQNQGRYHVNMPR